MFFSKINKFLGDKEALNQNYCITQSENVTPILGLTINLNLGSFSRI